MSEPRSSELQPPASLVAALAAFDADDAWERLPREQRQQIVPWILAGSNEGRRARWVAKQLDAGRWPDLVQLERREQFASGRRPVTKASIEQLLHDEWRDEPESNDARRSVVRLWAAGVVPQSSLPLGGQLPGWSPVAKAAREVSLDEAWAEMVLTEKTARPSDLREQWSDSEPVVAAATAIQRWANMGTLLVTANSVHYLPFAAARTDWKWRLDVLRLSGIEARFSWRGVTVTLVRAGNPSRRVHVANEVDALRVALRIRHVRSVNGDQSGDYQARLLDDVAAARKATLLAPPAADTARELLKQAAR